MSSLFSGKALDKHVDQVIEQPGNSAAVGVELVDGKPAAAVEIQGEHAGEKVTLTWGAAIRTRFSKATTSGLAKVGIRWP